MKRKPKRYNRTTAKKHVLQTTPYRVTKKTRKELLDSTDMGVVMDSVNKSLKNILVALAGTPAETYGISLVNTFKLKLDKKLRKSSNKKK